jgi:glycerol 3-phosphatase-2
MLADEHDVILFDLDGVIYAGPEAIPHAVEVVTELRGRGVRCAFITNNASRSAADVAAHLTALGLETVHGDVVTSAQAGVALLAARFAPGTRVLVVGGPGLHEEVRAAGFTICDTATEHPEAVIQGFGPDVGWRELAEASYAIGNGAYWVATNLDISVPTDRGRAPGNGAFVEAVRRAVGRAPDEVAGKPETALVQVALERCAGKRPLLVGDRLDTDIAGGNRAGIPTALVLTGISTAAEAREASGQLRPTYVLADLRGLLSDLPQ